MPLWFLGPLVALAAFGLTLANERRALRKKREPWVRLLSEDAQRATQTSGVGVLDGLATDGQGRLGPITAPFTGRTCIAFHIEVISRERYRQGNGEKIVWRRVFEDAHGQALVTSGDNRLVGRIDLRGAHILLPPELSQNHIGGVTVYRSSSSMFDGSALPPHLAAFVANLGLPTATKDSLFSSGRDLVFNERIVVPGQAIVAAGTCVVDPEGAGILVRPSEQTNVFFAFGTARALRISAGKVPIGEPLWSAFVVALLVGILTTMIVAFTSSDPKKANTPERQADTSLPTAKGVSEGSSGSVRWACEQTSLGLCSTYDVSGPNAKDNEVQLRLCQTGGGTVTSTCKGRPKVGCCTSKLSNGATQVRCTYADDPASAKVWTCDDDN